MNFTIFFTFKASLNKNPRVNIEKKIWCSELDFGGVLMVAMTDFDCIGRLWMTIREKNIPSSGLNYLWLFIQIMPYTLNKRVPRAEKKYQAHSQN